MAADEVTVQRNKILAYALGNYHASNVWDRVHKLRIAVVGQTGTGKTCLINTIWRAVNGKTAQDLVPLPEQDSGCEGSIFVEDLKIATSTPVFLVDTRGFFTNNSSEGMAFVRIISGQYRSGHRIHWLAEDANITTTEQAVNAMNLVDVSEIPFEERVHGVILVLSAVDPKLNNGTYTPNLRLPREWCHETGISPITVVTHCDMLAAEELEKVRRLASACSGCSPRNVYFISNYTSEHRHNNTATELAALYVLEAALNMSERFVTLRCDALDPAPPVHAKLHEVSVYDSNPNAPLKFKLNPAATFTELRTMVGKRTKLDLSEFSLLDAVLLCFSCCFLTNEKDGVECFDTAPVFPATSLNVQRIQVLRTPPAWGSDLWGPSRHKEVELAPESEEFLYISWLVQQTFDHSVCYGKDARLCF